jgi:two-component system, OmpR family, sensor histidine kinase KdpD
MQRRSDLFLMPDTPRWRALGVVAAGIGVAATTALIFPLRNAAPAVSLGVVYLLVVLVVSTFWGLWVGLATSIASALAFNWFHIPPTGRFTISNTENWVALLVFLAAAAMTSTLAEVARARTAEARRRQEEADLAAEMARVLLGGASLSEALPVASDRLAVALGLDDAELRIGRAADGDGEVVIEIGPEASLTVPAGIETSQLERVRTYVAPSLGAILAAAIERDRLLNAVVETQALRRSDVIKTAVLRAVSHDLRTPLTSIIAGADAIRSPSLSDADRDELGAVIGDEAQRLSRLVEKLLDLSRLQSGAAEPRADWVSVDDVVRTAAEAVEAATPGPPVQLHIEADLPLIEADAAQLERVFVNLLENARRYSGDHPVQVRARVVGSHLKVRVIDRGPGIPAGDLPYVFEPFRQGSQGGDHAGAGLGLAIVKGFVEANGATVTAESLPGQGAVFAIDFPLAEQHGEVLTT